MLHRRGLRPPEPLGINADGPVLTARATELLSWRQGFDGNNFGRLDRIGDRRHIGYRPRNSTAACGAGIYGATKAGLEQLTRVWADEFGESGVRVNAVAAGPTEKRLGPPLCRVSSRRSRRSPRCSEWQMRAKSPAL